MRTHRNHHFEIMSQKHRLPRNDQHSSKKKSPDEFNTFIREARQDYAYILDNLSSDDPAIFIRWNSESAVHLCLGISGSPVPQGSTANESLDNLRTFCAKLISNFPKGKICVNDNHLFIVGDLFGPDYVDFVQSFPVQWGAACLAAGISCGDALSFWGRGVGNAEARISHINGFLKLKH